MASALTGERLMGNQGSTGWQHPDCGGCSAGNCPAQKLTCETELQGWRLGFGAVAVFVAPCLLAILGAAASEFLAWGQLTGAIAGLLLGMGSVALAIRWLADGEERV